MPGSYQHLHLRLRIEQTRLLNWGQNVGLLEGILKGPSRGLEMNRNLILDILLEIQSTFKACTRITSSYDAIVHSIPIRSDSLDPSGTDSILRKTLALLKKTPQLSARLQWVMVKQDRFTKLIDELIGHNDAIEAFLDKAALDHLQLMHQRTYMKILQLTDKVDELKDLSQALQLRAHKKESDFGPGISRASTLVADPADGHDTAVRLVEFKAQQTISTSGDQDLEILDISNVRLAPNETDRPGAVYQGKQGWVEWKSYDKEEDPNSSRNKVIEDRVKSLVRLLASEQKPKEFRAPQCLGYFNDSRRGRCRYGLIYENPIQGLPHRIPMTLRSLLGSALEPSLTKRIALAHAIAESLMYLHSVNWLHKGVRSSNILFHNSPLQKSTKQAPAELLPMLSGFDYARPDLPDTMTERSLRNLEHDLYRHPELIGLTSSRSQKSHDIYSLGIVLVEIAYWQPIETVMKIDLKQGGATRRARDIRDQLLGGEDEYLTKIDSLMGEIFRHVIQKCLVGGLEIGIPPNGDETDPKVGVEMQRVFLEEIVGNLGGVRV